MAKRKLTALAGNININNFSNSNTAELSVMMTVDSIEYSEDFKSLFPLDDNKVTEIAKDITENGYDKSQPVHIWETLDGKKILIDGHTRLAASRVAQLYDIPVFIHHFENLQDALLYAVGLQVKRRNLNSQEILIAVQMFDSIKTTGRKPAGSEEETGRSSKKLADELGIGERTIQKARKVNKEASEETKEKLKNNEITINQAYEELPDVKARKGSKKVNLSDDELSDALEDNSGNPGEVIIHERKINTTGRMSPLSKEEDNERTRERKESYELGVKEGFEQCKNLLEDKYAHCFETALYWALAQMVKGKTAKEIYDDPAVSDLSLAAIADFKLSEEDDDLVYKLSME